MKTTFVRFDSIDNIELQGLYFLPDIKEVTSAIVHIHGLAGNFYENSFIDHMAQQYTNNGYAFLSFNNRGHDYINDVVRNEDGKLVSIQCGAAYEEFTECTFDIDGAVNFMRKKGITSIFLQGHSSGCNKIVYHLSQKKNTDIKGAILLSPCDDIGLHMESVKNNYETLMATAQKYIKEGNENEIMPDGTFYSYPLSARTYFSSFKIGSPMDVFHYRDTEDAFSQLNEIKIPLLVTFGNNGEFLSQPFNFVNEKVFKKLNNISAFEVDGAPHNYANKEEVLIKIILNWLSISNK